VSRIDKANTGGLDDRWATSEIAHQFHMDSGFPEITIRNADEHGLEVTKICPPDDWQTSRIPGEAVRESAHYTGSAQQ
jgi:hypothetical protein